MLSICGQKLIEYPLSIGTNKVALLFHLYLFYSFVILFLPVSHDASFLVYLGFWFLVFWLLFQELSYSVFFIRVVFTLSFTGFIVINLQLMPPFLEKKDYLQNCHLYLLEYLCHQFPVALLLYYGVILPLHQYRQFTSCNKINVLPFSPFFIFLSLLKCVDLPTDKYDKNVRL